MYGAVLLLVTLLLIRRHFNMCEQTSTPEQAYQDRKLVSQYTSFTSREDSYGMHVRTPAVAMPHPTRAFLLLFFLCAAAQALQHPYFNNAPAPTPPDRLPKPPLREDNPLAVSGLGHASALVPAYSNPAPLQLQLHLCWPC